MKTRRSLLLLLTLVLVIGGAGWFWVASAQRQYALNRELIAALQRHDTKTALVLVNAGADPNTRYTPPPDPTLELLIDQLLHHSPPPSNYSLTAFMFDCGREWNAPDNFSRADANHTDDVPLVRAMLAHGADCKAKDVVNWSALNYAVLHNSPDVAQILLEHGATINHQDIAGLTPLMQAVLNDDTKMTRLLLDHGADVAITDIGGQTALYHAVRRSKDRTILIQLLEHGADPNHPGKQGVTPLMAAQSLGRYDIVDLLRRKR